MKQRAEPWNLGEAAHSLSHTLSPPTLRLCSSPHKLPRSHPSFPLQPSRPSSGSPPGSMPACPSPLPTFPRGPSTHPPSCPLPPLQPRELCYARAWLGAHSHTKTPTYPGILLAPASLSSRIALVLAACAGSTVAPSSPHQPTATTPELPPSSQPSVPFPFLLFLFHHCPIFLAPNPTLCDLLIPPFYPIGTIYTQLLTMSSRKRKAGEEEEELVSLPSGDEESEEE